MAEKPKREKDEELPPGWSVRVQPIDLEGAHVSRQRAVLERSGNTVVLADWDTAAYLHGVCSLAIVDVEKAGPSTHIITLYDPDHRADDLAVAFLNSESSLFADASRRMKKIVHSFGGRGKQRRKKR